MILHVKFLHSQFLLKAIKHSNFNISKHVFIYTLLKKNNFFFMTGSSLTPKVVQPQ